ncbi:hypothetical protein [Streptococcus acidominimus]|uniref:Uncharacterized protein n=1 Tax=Streptococcus acidominimus TaxID=1326 RepID=A0A4Y9FMF1_STRAI|nr:hypothetical protein [Streptococcus acidominimus]MBF0819113.1 hypothetical protein [Streptococcus acidominimus]MBF0839737.1 hypothetical protein [Streptococcus acidominimus]MBF0848338.1 hypothetical protein [Streptococcus danieliae]TFU30341.1 hypothetical protein E4U01_06635 [Streptococcus acidominimus]
MEKYEIIEKQEEINRIDYWDTRVLDLKILYFGDEVHMYLEAFTAHQANLDKCWKISFIGCAEVNYETDVRNRKKVKVKDFVKNHLYTCQDISLEYHDETFVRCCVNLEGLVILSLICQDIEISKVSIADQHFFWDEN